MIRRAAAFNAYGDAYECGTTTDAGNLQVYFNPGKSYATVQIKETGRVRTGKRVLKDSPDFERLWSALSPLYLARTG